MDRIRKALDLARQERERLYSAPQVLDEPRVEIKVAASQVPVSIAYTTSRTFTAGPALLESNRIVDSSANNPAAAAFRMLRTQVLQRMDEHGWRSLAVLSPRSEDGKTTTAINLAMSLANNRQHTVLLVDSDLRSPAIGAALGLAPEFGLEDVLRGQARVEQCLYHPEGFDRLLVLPAREAIANSSEVLAGPQGRALVAELRARYPERLILFDLPPVLMTDDALAFLPLVECGLVVVAERVTSREDLLRCMELVRKTPIVGTVLNRATDAHSGYG
ncbi:MAG TPA: CpsD/CapB family tyrosine-protein kinase [Steroidobacteraceae bacterium]